MAYENMYVTKTIERCPALSSIPSFPIPYHGIDDNVYMNKSRQVKTSQVKSPPLTMSSSDGFKTLWREAGPSRPKKFT